MTYCTTWRGRFSTAFWASRISLNGSEVLLLDILLVLEFPGSLKIQGSNWGKLSKFKSTFRKMKSTFTHPPTNKIICLSKKLKVGIKNLNHERSCNYIASFIKDQDMPHRPNFVSLCSPHQNSKTTHSQCHIDTTSLPHSRHD